MPSVKSQCCHEYHWKAKTYILIQGLHALVSSYMFVFWFTNLMYWILFPGLLFFCCMWYFSSPWPHLLRLVMPPQIMASFCNLQLVVCCLKDFSIVLMTRSCSVSVIRACVISSNEGLSSLSCDGEGLECLVVTRASLCAWIQASCNELASTQATMDDMQQSFCWPCLFCNEWDGISLYQSWQWQRGLFLCYHCWVCQLTLITAWMEFFTSICCLVWPRLIHHTRFFLQIGDNGRLHAHPFLIRLAFSYAHDLVLRRSANPISISQSVRETEEQAENFVLVLQSNKHFEDNKHIQ